MEVSDDGGTPPQGVLLASPLTLSSARVMCNGPCWCGVLYSLCPDRQFDICSPVIVEGSDDDVAIPGAKGANDARDSGSYTSSKGRPFRLVGLAGQLIQLTGFCLGVGGQKCM